MRRANAIAGKLDYTGFNDVMIAPSGEWISPAAEAYTLGWKAGYLFVWSGPDGYAYRRPL